MNAFQLISYLCCSPEESGVYSVNYLKMKILAALILSNEVLDRAMPSLPGSRESNVETNVSVAYFPTGFKQVLRRIWRENKTKKVASRGPCGIDERQMPFKCPMAHFCADCEPCDCEEFNPLFLNISPKGLAYPHRTIVLGLETLAGRTSGYRECSGLENISSCTFLLQSAQLK